MLHAGHILTYAQSMAGGGVERAMLRLARGWIGAGRRVTLVLGSREGPLAREIEPAITIVPLGSPRYLALRHVAGHVAALRPDVVFCPGSHYTSAAAWLRIARGRSCPPIVAKLSNALVRDDHSWVVAQANSWWLRQQPRFIDAMVAMTPASADALVAATGIARDRVAIIPNPPPTLEPGVHPDGLPPRYILGVGRLAGQKRWDRAIAALPRLADRALPLVILGDGAERAGLQAQAARLGVGDRVLMPGHCADPAPAMARAAALILTSDFEGVPGVLREALALGTPIVTTDSSPAIAEIVSSPTMGDIVVRDNQDALVAAIDRWTRSDAVRPRPVPMPGADAAERYLDLFDRLVTARATSGSPSRPPRAP